MADVRWALSKSKKLKRKRGVSFEEIVRARLVAVKEHPSRSHQNILLFELGGYIWVVPYVARGETVFLKTLFPSRKYTRMWKKGELA
ncbi:MAG: toxin [Nitrospirae bacterium]|nr:toxin [Nitrospirota bacterium]